MGTPTPILDDGKLSDVPVAPRSLTINASAVFIASILVQLGGFVGSVFVYKYVGVDAAGQALFGTVQLFFLIASTINGIGDLRLGSGYVLMVARGRSPTSNTGTYLFVRTAMVVGISVVVFLFASVSIDGRALASSPQDYEALALFMSMPFLYSASTVYSLYCVGVGDAAKGQIPSLVEVAVRAPVLIAVAFLWPTLIGLSVAFFLGALGSALYCVPVLLPLVRRYKSSEAVSMFRYSLPLLGGLVLSTIATTTIPFVVQASLGATALNLFNGANAFRVTALAVPSAITAPLLPHLAGLHKREEYNQVRESTWQALRYLSMLMVPGIVALVVYRVNLLYILYNASYVGPAQVPLAILGVAAVPAAYALVIGTGLDAIGWRRLELYLTAIQVGSLFGIAVALMPPYGLLPASDGLVSASIAVLASSVAALAINAYFMHRLMAVHIAPRSVFNILVSAVLSFASISVLNDFLPINRYYQLALGVALGFVVYYLVLCLIGELAKEDVDRLGRSIGLPARLISWFARFCWRVAAPHQLPAVDLSGVPGLTAGYQTYGRSLPPREPPKTAGGSPPSR